MADPRHVNSRTYWQKSGVDPKTGKPFTTTTEQSTGGNETQYRDDTYADGKNAWTVTSRWNPDTGEWDQTNVVPARGLGNLGADGEQAATGPSANTQATVDAAKARNDARIAEHQRAQAQAQEAARQRAIIAAQNKLYNQPIQEPGGTSVVNPADQGTNPDVDTPAAVTSTTPGRTVTQAQANYDRQMAQDEEKRRQDAIANRHNAEVMAHEWANTAWTQAQGSILDAYRNRELDLTTARDEANKAYQAIQAQLEQQRNAISDRAVTASLRGQDVNAGVQQRSQDMSLIGNLADVGSRNAMGSLAYYVGPGQMDSFNQAMGAMGTTKQIPFAPITPGRFPFDPRTLAADQARQAQAVLPPQYSTPPAPPPIVAPTQYALPPRSDATMPGAQAA